MKYIEKQIILSINKRLPLRKKIIMLLLKKYTFDIYKMGYDDGFLFENWQGCNKAVIKNVSNGEMLENSELHKSE